MRIGSAAAPLAGLRFSLVGPGRVGTSLSRWAVAAGAELVAATGRAGLAELASGGQDLLLIAAPDGALAEVAERLAARPQAAVALHTSGSREAAVLAPLYAAGCRLGALHPLKAFPRPLPEPEEARGVFFGLDGDAEALAVARRLVAAWGGVAGEVPAAARPLYHFAASLAAGGVATLLAAAAELAARAGLPPAVGDGYLELARGAVAAAIAVAREATAAGPGAGPAPDPATAAAPAGAGGTDRGGAAWAAAAAALTGPVARGDLATFARHLEALRAVAPERLPLALELARETVRQADAAGAAGPAGAGRRELLAWIDRLQGGGGTRV
jgi:predicted short-subunit dehydrogenase-like oxidoreductase (DUF2520 family)